ncbi:MAG: hypothetical protein GYA33_13005 [Thermogutta sp.]|nr:hypothetical protein [Thermogutta sp.]
MARGVIAALVGFAVSVSFISVVWLELPYYTVLLGAVLLRVNSASAEEQSAGEQEVPDEESKMLAPAI